MTFTLDSFGGFFAAIHRPDGAITGASAPSPYRWQRRLLESLVDTGRWPDQIAAPTGAGKTFAIEAHVFAVALMARGQAPAVPRRLSMVVGRRALVDDQYEHARRIQRLLREAESGVTAEVARALRELHTTEQDEVLHVVRLRGGAAVDSAWRDDPTGCQVLCGTPDMWGSRLLLGGYGSSRGARPRDAGLLAFDSVVVVDEAHLARQLVYSARRVADLCHAIDEQMPMPVLQVVETTATPNAGHGTAIGVEQDDLAPGQDDELARRLTTPKPVRLLELDAWPLPRTGPVRRTGLAELATAAVQLRAEFGPTVGCFVNNVATATDLAKHLASTGDQVKVKLVCGRMRPRDLDNLRKEYPGILDTCGNDNIDFIVSTQSLEVGADLDWSALLTEPAPGSALAQRAGRVNRRGLRAETRIVVVMPREDLGALDPKDKEDRKKIDSIAAAARPYEFDDLAQSQSWLSARSADPAGLAPWALVQDPPPGQSRRRTLYQRPELADSWAWAATSERPHAEANLDLWLSDSLDPDQDIGIVIRHGLPDDLPDARELLRATMPRAHEIIPARISALPEKLRSLSSPDSADDGRPQALLVRGDDVFPAASQRLGPGDVLVLDDTWPIFTVVDNAPLLLGLSADKETGSDVLEEQDDSFILRLGDGSLLDVDAPDFKEPVEKSLRRIAQEHGANLDTRAARERLVEALADLQVTAPEPFASQFRVAARLLCGRIKDCAVAASRGEQTFWLVIADTRRNRFDEELRQQWTTSDAPVSLSQHRANVAARCREIAGRVGLDSKLTALLARAGLHHDDGKYDARFQASLGALPGSILAKSGMNSGQRIKQRLAASGLLSGWRHEQLSVVVCWPLLSDLSTDEQFLVARLVGTSHGRGRPCFPHNAADLAGSDGELFDVAARLFDEGEWDHLIEHTHRVYGVWACAYLEALLRAADGQVSGEGS